MKLPNKKYCATWWMLRKAQKTFKHLVTPQDGCSDAVEAFLQMFENTANTKGWPRDDWAWALAPLLTGETQHV